MKRDAIFQFGTARLFTGSSLRMHRAAPCDLLRFQAFQLSRTKPLARQGFCANEHTSTLSTCSPQHVKREKWELEVSCTRIGCCVLEQVEGAWLLEGHCNAQVNGRYELQGRTASGRPFYKHSNVPLYLYYDPDCDGNPATSGGTGATWRVSDSAPSMSLEQDLDSDGECRSWALLGIELS